MNGSQMLFKQEQTVHWSEVLDKGDRPANRDRVRDTNIYTI